MAQTAHKNLHSNVAFTISHFDLKHTSEITIDVSILKQGAWFKGQDVFFSIRAEHRLASVVLILWLIKGYLEKNEMTIARKG